MRFCFVSGMMVVWTVASARAATPAEIDTAIEKARGYLYSQQKPSGHWETDEQRRGNDHDLASMQGDTFGGYTALAVYALLSAGESLQDPRIVSARRFLEDADMIGIYGLGIRANLWAYYPFTDKKARAMSNKDGQLLVHGLQTGNPPFARTRGMWDYGNGWGPAFTGRGRFDHSVSQYGVLGLWACAQNDVPIDRAVWEMIDEAWKGQQYPDGGWAYDTAPPGSGRETASMTAAGVATLFITDDMLYPNHGVDCRGNISNSNIDRGLQWMADHFHEVDNAYTLYGVERIGAASGRKYFGDTNWFSYGADKLIKSQKPDGSWGEPINGGLQPVPTAAFGLLFLARGRQPVMINKLQYDLTSRTTMQQSVGNWNQRPRDIANLTHWVGHQIEHGLNWQTVNLKAPLEDLHAAPILYVSGDQELSFSPAEEVRLLEFVQGGGMIVGNADCGLSKLDFSKSFERLGQRLFPPYTFGDLPADHPIFTGEQYSSRRWKTPLRLRALSNGVREFMILIPDSDPARAWQMRSEQNSAPLFEVAANIFLYAVDKQNLSERSASYLVEPDANIIADRSAKVARLMVGDNPDPEPAGWRRLAALLHNQFSSDIDVQPVKLGTKKLTGFKVAHLTGTGRLTLTAAQRGQLAEFVANGGTLVVDAGGGNAAFAASALDELKATFGPENETALKTPLPPESDVYRLPGAKIYAVTYRERYRRQVVGKLKTPRLAGITRNNRVAVFYSAEDLSGGLVGQPTDGIAGYSPQSATDLMRNIVLYGGFHMRAAGTK